MRDRLTILITNIAFAFRSGTEIVVDQIARGLNRRGHRPIVFAPYVGGGLTAGLRLRGIAVVDRLNQVGCTPDVIHGQHNVTTVMAMAAFPRTAALFSCHDFDAAKDRAPLLPRMRRYIAVDDTCRERLVRDGAPQDKIEVVYNAVDLDQYHHRGPLPRRAERALVLTKGSEHLATVRSAAATAGLALDELGSGVGAVVDDLPARLPAYDIVIATARMAKEAIAAGCAVVVCDHRGFAGLATTDTLAEWRRYNFGRRILAQPTTEDRLVDAFTRYDAGDAARVSARVRAEDNLDLHIDRLEGIYHSILDDGRVVDPAGDLEALAPFLEDFLISRNFSRPWVELHRNVTDEASDVLELALSRHTGKLRTEIAQGLENLARGLDAELLDQPTPAPPRGCTAVSTTHTPAEAPTTPRAVLIVAHPGHELLLHHWLERAQPIVCALTDGSGGHAQSRSGRSMAIIQRAGAHVGPVFAAATDREWYRAILTGDRRLFDAAAAQISELCYAQGVTQIVADALEFFNPMHDLCSCLAQHVSMQLLGSGAIELLTYPIERPDLLNADPNHVYALDDAALRRKLDAAAEYHELTAEVERRRISAIEHLAVERLFSVDINRVWPRLAPEEPFYEKYGRDKIERGTYAELITYADHVRPLAAMLTGGGAIPPLAVTAS
jgi:hypothetical protein